MRKLPNTRGPWNTHLVGRKPQTTTLLHRISEYANNPTFTVHDFLVLAPIPSLTCLVSSVSTRSASRSGPSVARDTRPSVPIWKRIVEFVTFYIHTRTRSRCFQEQATDWASIGLTLSNRCKKMCLTELEALVPPNSKRSIETVQPRFIKDNFHFLANNKSNEDRLHTRFDRT